MCTSNCQLGHSVAYCYRDMTVDRLRKSIAILSVKSEDIVHSVKKRIPSRSSESESERNDFLCLENFVKNVNLEATVTEERSCRFVYN